MSGGFFNYDQRYLKSLAEDLIFDFRERLKNQDIHLQEVTILNCYASAVTNMLVAEMIINRLDYLYSGDDSFQTFGDRLLEDNQNVSDEILQFIDEIEKQKLLIRGKPQ